MRRTDLHVLTWAGETLSRPVVCILPIMEGETLLPSVRAGLRAEIEAGEAWLMLLTVQPSIVVEVLPGEPPKGFDG